MAVPADPKVRRKEEAQGTDFTKTLNEVWEFTSGRVHKAVVVRSKERKISYQRTNSVPVNTDSICKDLLTGKIAVIRRGEGVGDPVLFAGTDFEYGHRSMEIYVDGKLELELLECCVFPGMAESDAHAFAAIYEQLAESARTAFEPKARK